MPTDTIVYDLEDSVAAHRKGVAQGMVLQALQAAPSNGPELAVRINAPSNEPDMARADLDVVLQSQRVQAIVLPKVESVDDIELVARSAADVGMYTPTSPLSLILSVESAASLLHMPRILELAAQRMASLENKARVVALMFSSEDYCASTGIRRTRDRRSLLYPRANLATVAKAYGLQAIVSANF